MMSLSYWIKKTHVEFLLDHLTSHEKTHRQGTNVAI